MTILIMKWEVSTPPLDTKKEHPRSDGLDGPPVAEE